MPFQIIRDDITRVKADAIVYAEDPKPAAGGTESAVCEVAGEAVVTPVFAMPAKYRIQTAGPAWIDGRHGEWEILASCYRKPLQLAEQLGCGSIAFPLIFAGTDGFSKQHAFAVAAREIREFLEGSDMEVLLVILDKDVLDLPEFFLLDVRRYVEKHYVPGWDREEDAQRLESVHGGALPDAAPTVAKEKQSLRKRLRRRREKRIYEDMSLPMPREAGSLPAASEETILSDHLQDVVRQVGESFQERLFRLIDERSLSDPQVYKKANIDRKLFSKIRCNTEYSPGKKTVLALAVALELNLDQATDLLARAGYAFSPSSRMDLVVKYCIEHQIFDIIEVNTILFSFDLPLLG